MSIDKDERHPVIPEVRRLMKLLGKLDESAFDDRLGSALEAFVEERDLEWRGAIDQQLIDSVRAAAFGKLAEDFLRLPVERILQGESDEPQGPDHSKPGSFGTFGSAAWGKFIINGVDHGWYVRHRPLTKDDCGKEFLISVCVGDDVAGCANLNYAQWCNAAKAEGTRLARTLCPGDCPNPLITDHAGKWDCGRNPASRTGFRAFCHHQIKLVCFSA